MMADLMNSFKDTPSDYIKNGWLWIEKNRSFTKSVYAIYADNVMNLIFNDNYRLSWGVDDESYEYTQVLATSLETDENEILIENTGFLKRVQHFLFDDAVTDVYRHGFVEVLVIGDEFVWTEKDTQSMATTWPGVSDLVS